MWGYLLGEYASNVALTQSAGQAYADLVAAGKDVALWPDHLRQQMYLGDEAFVVRMQALASDRAVSRRARAIRVMSSRAFKVRPRLLPMTLTAGKVGI